MKNIIKNFNLFLSQISLERNTSSNADKTLPTTFTGLAIVPKVDSLLTASSVAGKVVEKDLTSNYTVAATPKTASSEVVSAP